MENEGYYPDYVMLLQPTSPLRTDKDIKAAIDLALRANADSIISVCEAMSHPYKIRKISDSGTLIDFVEKPEGYLPRQIFPPAYHENGAVYLVKRDIILLKKTLYPNNTYPYIMKQDNSLDVDTFWDFYLAELVLKDRNKRDLTGNVKH
jgi:CMP-N-acetylneuraminic acid synthetase